MLYIWSGMFALGRGELLSRYLRRKLRKYLEMKRRQHYSDAKGLRQECAWPVCV